jgi:hypothetical protein
MNKPLEERADIYHCLFCDLLGVDILYIDTGHWEESAASMLRIYYVNRYIFYNLFISVTSVRSMDHIHPFTYLWEPSLAKRRPDASFPQQRRYPGYTATMHVPTETA